MPGGDISIHAPHEGERLANTIAIVIELLFQSTLPTRGSDSSLVLPALLTRYFNPRSPRGGATGIELIISHNQTDFNPRSPRGGATNKASILWG